MKKKGSLSLALEGIILVIIAIAVVALGLVLIRGIFSKMTLKVNEAIDANELVNPPTRDLPLTLTPPEHIIKQGNNAKTTLAFLNVLPDRAECRLTHLTETASAAEPEIMYNSGCFMMEKDQINTWTIVVNAEKNADPEPTIFTIEMDCYEHAEGNCTGDLEGSFTKDLVVRIKE